MSDRIPLGRSRRATARTAVTLVELLTVIGIITILMAILLPALNSARESGRQTACQSNLKQFGEGLQEYASRHSGQFCSGAFDWLGDGSVTDYGWVADLVNSNIPVGRMLCPSNPAKLSYTYIDLLDADITTGDYSTDSDGNYIHTCAQADLDGSEAKLTPGGTSWSNPCRRIVNGGAPLGPGDLRTQIVEEEILRKHYNTNYTASWFLVRTGVKTTAGASGGALIVEGGCANTDVRLQTYWRPSTLGPLSQAYADSSAAPLSLVPALGCGAQAGLLSRKVGDYESGTPVVASLTRGPVHNPSMAHLTDGGWSTWNNTLQDYRRFAPVHKRSCNILFLDGGVRSIEDLNNDGVINNGFGENGGANGFANAVPDVNKEDLFSKWSLREQY